MKFYRVECNGSGPFHHKWSNEYWRDKFYETIHYFRHPEPDIDGGDLEKLFENSYTGAFNLMYGCANIEQIKFWFRNAASFLKAEGFLICIYEVERVYCGKTQAAVFPAQAELADFVEWDEIIY